MAARAVRVIDDVGSLEGFDVVLAASAEQAAALGAQAAHELPGGLLSCEVTTVDSWLSHLWELWGDGRAPVSPSARVLAMARALEEARCDALPLRPRTAIAAARAVSEAAGLREFEDAVADVPGARGGLCDAERALLDAVGSYEGMLARLGLVEPGQAVARLAADAGRVFARPCRVALLGTAPLAPVRERLLERGREAGSLEVVRPQGETAPAVVARPPQGVDLSFAFPSGAYATAQAVLGLVGELGADGAVVVCARDPLPLYERIAPALARRGVSCAVRGSRTWRSTSFGSAFLSLVYERGDEGVASAGRLPWDKGRLADAAASAVVGHARGSLWRRDAEARSDRLLSRPEAEARMAEADAALCELIELVESPGDAALDAMEAYVARRPGLEPAGRDEERAAVEALRELARTAHELGVGPNETTDRLRWLLEGCSVGVRGCTSELAPGEAPQVLVEGMAEAAEAPAGSCATMVVLDLDSTSYPSARRDDACSLLLDRLGVPRGEGYLDAARRRFASCVAAPTSHLVVGRCLNDEQAAPLYPAALLEELVDLYRDDPSADDLDPVFGLPGALLPRVRAVGEEDLVGDVAPGHGEGSFHAAAPAIGGDELPARLAYRAGVREARPAGAGQAAPGAGEAGRGGPLVLSPAQMEDYLACPGYWLATRRLRTNAPDEGFGPREQGTYRHDVLQAFYQRFRCMGHRKVSVGTMEDARRALGEALGEVDARARELDARGLPAQRLRRCVALPGTTEELVMARMREQLAEWLEFECSFLPGPDAPAGGRPDELFEPRAFELPLAGLAAPDAAPDAAPARGPAATGPDGTGGLPAYAGCLVTGRVDRVDVSCDGSRLVVVDYKGSIGPDYDLVSLGEGGLSGTEKIQALVYASVLERSGLFRAPDGTPATAVGALYVSYRRGHDIRGSFDGTALTRERHLPTLPARAEGLSPEGLHDLMAQVEDEVAARVVAPLAAGDVEPRPASDTVCSRCPNLGCARRRVPHAS